MPLFCLVIISVANPRHFYADPDFHFNTDPDPTFLLVADLNLGPHQSDESLQPLV